MIAELAGPAYDFVYSSVAIAAIVLFVIALRAWFRSPRADFFHFLALLVILFVPVVGPIAYVWASREFSGPARQRSVSPRV